MPERVFASIAIGGTEGAPDVIQYFPAGESEISATVNGRPGRRKVRVEKGIEAKFQSSLEKLLSGNVRPYINFDHKVGPASGYPKRFFWQDAGEGQEGGLMLEVDWTRAGKEAVEGRDYGYFSGEFLLSKDGVPVGLDTNQRPIGALVNDPAFENNARIAAAKADLIQPELNIMPDLTPLIEAGLLSADEAKQDDALKVAARRHKEAKDTKELDTVKAAKAEADSEIEKLKARLAERDERDAKDFVEEAVKAGKIKAKDEDAKAEWAKVYAANPAGAKKLLDAVPSITEGLKPVQRGDRAPDHRSDVPGADKVAAAKAKARAEGRPLLQVLSEEITPDDYEDYRQNLG